MSYSPPITEQRFVLDHVVDIADLSKAERFEAATPDMVDAILEGAGALASGEYAPLNRVGDTVGAKWTPDGVTMPDGFKAAYDAFVEGGWSTLAAPAEHGGQGLPFSLATVVMEDLGTANMGFSLVNMLNAGAIEAIVHHGSAEQHAAWLPRLVTGEWTGTMNLTEPQAGSDVGALRTTATPAGDGSWRISGTKIFITYGEHDLADNIVHLVLARTPDAPAGTKGISLFLVPKFRLNDAGEPAERNGVACLSIEHKLGIHASPTCVMGFGEGGECHGWLIGEEGGGMRAMFTMMNHARLNVGLQGVQIAERATQAAVDYARGRVQSARAGKPVAIVEHPDVRRMLIRMKALTQGARALVYYAAGQLDRATLGDAHARARAELLVPLAKAWGTDVGCEVASIGVQVHGGMGFVEETGAAQHYRDARIAPIYEGTNGIQAADLIGRKMSMNGGDVFRRLLDDIRAEGVPELAALSERVDVAARYLTGNEADADDRLAGSYPFLTMLSVLTAGWLMARQGKAVEAAEGDPAFLAMKRVAVRFFLERIVPEAEGLLAAATAGAAGLYAVDAEVLAA
ncbi:alkylation response protein AidB-like acyl-CoA dehydrogenase [Sphingomonas jejuensis]|uniref:Alkylation response protein AidB-like acyl-CoA dehydrogenase n=1 Tax=Sphingomonas jejuensis TaxID=904715 RepID=A0ABX0XN26_9SPHN|nr:acyl-CoA dehydrogenase [Sphingomonas jejuensis]NJC34100.1 alkylation response protein AidB-like acyl-CoA dehydrogenase [Sphingomonas jejuensis]